MDNLQRYYSPKILSAHVRNPLPSVTHTNEFFNPVVAHRWAGHFPLLDPEKRVVFQLEQYPTTIFQHVPSFSYYPDHSNVDVNLTT